MKTKIVQVLISILKYLLRLIYFFLKFIPVKNTKIVFCSRQSNNVPLDFVLIKNELEKRNQAMEMVFICRHVGNSINTYMKYVKAFLQSMYHMATCTICVIDSYWPAVSLLDHKDSLTVIQIWHSIGKVKQSGYQTIGKKSGRKSEYSEKLNMHGNYDYVIAGSKIWNRFYCESFNITEDKILNFGLPRIDYLLNTEQRNKERFRLEFPEWENKIVVLYAPTFRRNMKAHWERIIDAAKSSDIVLIVKKHPGQEGNIGKLPENVSFLEEWDTVDLIAVCDYLITDYSAIAVEAAVLKKKTYYWVYDYEQYVENNGLNIDLYAQFPGHVFKDIDLLMKTLMSDRTEGGGYYTYPREYLPEKLGAATEQIVDLIIGSMKKKD